jgi:hypothetical protein
MGLNFYREDPRSPRMNLKPARVGGSGDGAGNTAPHEFCSTSFASERVPAPARCTWGASNRNQNFHLRGYGARVKNFIDHAFDPSRHRSLMSLGMVAGSIANAVLFYGLAIGTCDDQVPMVRVGRHSLRTMPPARWLEPRMADVRAIRPVLIHGHDLLKR